MKILIATPAYGGNLRAEYTVSLIDTVKALGGRSYDYITVSGADIVRNRNLISSMFYRQEEFTHLLFIDGDMMFAPQSVTKLIEADLPIVGHIYPKKTASFDQIITSAQERPSNAKALARCVDFVVGFDHGANQVRVKQNGLTRVRALGMGLCLIRREVFSGLVKTGKIREGREVSIGTYTGPEYGFFDQIEDNIGIRLSEDFSFCHRWNRFCGGDIWGFVTDQIGHVGSIVYTASYGDRLSQGKL